MLKFISELLAAIASFFSYKAKTHNQDTIQSLQNDIHTTKNSIINELNKPNPDMFFIRRLYHHLQDLQERKKYL